MFRKTLLTSNLVALVAAVLYLALPHNSDAQDRQIQLVQIEGTIARVDGTSVTVREGDKEATLSISENTQVKMGGKPATVADLKVGQRASIITDGQMILAIEVFGQAV